MSEMYATIPPPVHSKCGIYPPQKHKIMNYRFISTAQRINKVDASAAAEISGITDILNYSKCIGEYTFKTDEELTKTLNKADSIAIVRKVSNSGIVSYRAEILLNGGKYIARLFGSGRGATYAERNLSADEIKKAVFGFCASDGEIVTDLKTDGMKAVKVPVIYMQTA